MNNETTTLISLKEAMKRLLRAMGREQAWVCSSGKME
ncbi:SMCO1 isoform 2 [Pongo abelii]|uniref:SMCO1 isoform 2 n=1 Tax=Pongo abelii TaxID=9601 RepID=A0A2J8RG65_PONAB|nr:SMCO1 isoform 2 [Pongo abelii]